MKPVPYVMPRPKERVAPSCATLETRRPPRTLRTPTLSEPCPRQRRREPLGARNSKVPPSRFSSPYGPAPIRPWSAPPFTTSVRSRRSAVNVTTFEPAMEKPPDAERDVAPVMFVIR